MEAIKVTSHACHVVIKCNVPQGWRGMEKKDMGSKIFELTCGPGLPKYVSGRLSIYGNGISIYG